MTGAVARAAAVPAWALLRLVRSRHVTGNLYRLASLSSEWKSYAETCAGERSRFRAGQLAPWKPRERERVGAVRFFGARLAAVAGVLYVVGALAAPSAGSLAGALAVAFFLARTAARRVSAGRRAINDGAESWFELSYADIATRGVERPAGGRRGRLRPGRAAARGAAGDDAAATVTR